MSKLSDWWNKWFGPGTPDDWRNPFWRYFEGPGAVKVDEAFYLFDLPLGFKREGKWKFWFCRTWEKVDQNWWNAIFSVNLQIISWYGKTGNYNTAPKLMILIRFLPGYYFLFASPMYLFDGGAFHAKLAIMNAKREIEKYGCNEPLGWEESGI